MHTEIGCSCLNNKDQYYIVVEENLPESQHSERIISLYSLATLLIPIIALVFVLAYGNLLAFNYLHVLTGGTWTGIDLFMGIVMGRILKGLDPQARTQVIKRLVPLMLFLMPALATVAITSGINLASKLGMLSFASPMIIAAVVIVVILSIQGFGIIMPTEVRIFLELRKNQPNREKIIRWGMRNVKLAGSQGILQIALIFVMANLALGFTLLPK